MDFTSKLVSTHVRLSLTAAFVQEKKPQKNSAPLAPWDLAEIAESSKWLEIATLVLSLRRTQKGNLPLEVRAPQINVSALMSASWVQRLSPPCIFVLGCRHKCVGLCVRAGALASRCVGAVSTGVQCALRCSCCETRMSEQKAPATLRAT